MYANPLIDASLGMNIWFSSHSGYVPVLTGSPSDGTDALVRTESRDNQSANPVAGFPNR